MKIEICAACINSAIAASNAKVDRIELCSALEIGGLTPSAGLIKNVMEATSLKINVLIRPRSGNFCYNKDEIKNMIFDIDFCKKNGVNGIVVGALSADGTIDKKNMKELIKAAENLPVTFHRAFDYTIDPLRALNEIIELNCKRILTSGCQNSAIEGASFIATLVEKANNKIIIMPGGGINEENIEELIAKTNATEFHLSASKQKNTINCNAKVKMGNTQNSFNYTISDENLIKNVVSIVKQ